jgi:hypothetical protein
MAAAGEMAEAGPNDVAPYTEQVQNLGQVNEGELVVVRALPPQGRQLPGGIALGPDKILMVRGKIQDYNGKGPTLDVGLKIPLQPKPRDFMRFAVFRRPGGGPAAAGAGAADVDFARPRPGGKRRKTRKTKKSRRKTTRRRWFY